MYIGGNPYESEIIFAKDYAESEGKYLFLHKDYLGSILAISDEEGNSVEQRHYDAWAEGYELPNFIRKILGMSSKTKISIKNVTVGHIMKVILKQKWTEPDS